LVEQKCSDLFRITFAATISRRLGHGSPTITLSVYGHLFPQTDDRAAQIMEAAFTAAEAAT